MTQTGFKLVALDLDGTILDDAGHVVAGFGAVAAQLAELGVHVVLCTGRRWRTALHIAEQLPRASPIVICCGGALIKDAAEHRTLYINPISSDTARRAAELFRAGGLVPFLLMNRPLDRRELLISELDRPRAEQLPYIVANEHAVEYYRGPFPALREAVLEVYTLDDGSVVRAQMKMIRDALGDAAIVTLLSQPLYGPTQVDMEVHNPTATKWQALLWLLERWGIAPEQVVAMGDDMNDIPMLRGAGLSFAMGDAPDEVKAAADRVTGTCVEGGAAAALRIAFPELV